MSDLPREAGRSAFGADAANYDTARPDYPQRVFEILRERCGLARGTRTLEIGPGTGQATRALIENGADPLVAVEPDARLAARLTERTPGVRALYATFSQIATLEPQVRNRLLDGIQEIATKDFADRVERRMVTAVYTAQRR